MDRQPPIIVTLDRFVFVRMFAAADTDSITPITAAVRAASARLGHPLYLVQFSDASIEPPTREQQIASAKATVEWFKMIDEYHVVLEGDSLRQNVTRMTIRGLLATAKIGGKVFGVGSAEFARKTVLHGSEAEFFAATAAKFGMPAATVRSALGDARILARRAM